MEQQSDTLSITLKIGSWTLPMTIRRSDEFIYRQAEKLIKERFNYYTGNYPNQRLVLNDDYIGYCCTLEATGNILGYATGQGSFAAFACRVGVRTQENVKV